MYITARQSTINTSSPSPGFSKALLSCQEIILHAPGCSFKQDLPDRAVACPPTEGQSFCNPLLPAEIAPTRRMKAETFWTVWSSPLIFHIPAPALNHNCRELSLKITKTQAVAAPGLTTTTHTCGVWTEITSSRHLPAGERAAFGNSSSCSSLRATSRS